MAEEVIIKVDGLQDLKQIEASFQAFTTSINAAINALAASGNKSFVGAVKQISVETANLNKITSQNTTETKANEEATKRATRAKQEFTRATGAASKGAIGMYGATYQLSQVMRELPNFAIDARIGFLSLSNNLPMLADSFMMLSKSIDVSTGKLYGTRGALKAFGASLLSFNAIMIVATTLLTLYGEKIVDYVKSLFVATKETDNFSESIKRQLEVTKDFSGAASKTISDIQKLGIEIKNYGDKSENSKKIIEDFNKTFGEHATSIEEVKKLYPELAKAAIENAIKIQAADKLISESATQILRKSGAELILKQFDSKQVKETQDAFLLFIGQYKSSLEGLGMSSDDAQRNVNELWKAFQEGDVVGTIFQGKLQEAADVIGGKYGLVGELKKAFDLLSTKEGTTIAGALATKMGSQTELNKLQKTIDQVLKGVNFTSIFGSAKETKGTKAKESEEFTIKDVFGFDYEWLNEQYKNIGELNKEIRKDEIKSSKEFSEELSKQVEEANKANIDLLESDRITRDANRQAQLDTLSELGTLTDAFAGLYDARIEKVNNYYDLEAARIEGSVMSEAAKNDALIKLDQERYAEELKLFEARKQWQIATAWMDFAAGSIGIWTAPGITKLAPFGAILASVQQAALLAQTIQQTQNIAAQKPNAPKAIGSGGGGIGSVSAMTALSPQKTALTSSEENLNMMNATNFTKQTNVVKVSEINKVQNNVKVRETNQSY